MFEKFNLGSSSARQTDGTGLTKDEANQLTVLENQIATRERVQNLNNKLRAIQANEPMDMAKVLDILGNVGQDGLVDSSIVEGMRQFMGNNSDPIKATQYFSGLIARRFLSVADVRKVPANLLAYRGGSAMDITSNLVYAQPVRLFGAASALQPARFQQTPLNLAFNDDGQIVQGTDVFNKYTTATSGTYSRPFIGHLFILKRKDTLKGDSKFYAESEYGYRMGLQLTDDTGAVLMLNHTPAIKVSSSTALVTSAPPLLGVELGFASSELEEQFELDTTSPMDVSVQGTNVSITHYQLPMYTPLSEAILAALISGRLDMMPVWMLNNLSSQFMF